MSVKRKKNHPDQYERPPTDALLLKPLTPGTSGERIAVAVPRQEYRDERDDQTASHRDVAIGQLLARDVHVLSLPRPLMRWAVVEAGYRNHLGAGCHIHRASRPAAHRLASG